MHTRIIKKGEQRMICKSCGKTFTPTHHRQKYCSDDCRVKSRKIQNRESKIRWRKKQSKKVLIKCKWCGKYFVRNKQNKRTLFCCKTCKKESELEHNRDRQFKFYYRCIKSNNRHNKKIGLGTGKLGKHRKENFEDEKKAVKNEKRRIWNRC